jgi:hypothetical protein
MHLQPQFSVKYATKNHHGVIYRMVGKDVAYQYVVVSNINPI